MIVVGVDPGARHTAVVAVSLDRPAGLDLGRGASIRLAEARLLRHTTIDRDTTEPMLDVSREHLVDIAAVIAEAQRELDPALIGVEGLRKPTGFARGQKHSLDPAPLVAAGIVLGSILGRTYGRELVVVPPGLNGSQAISLYPEELRPTRGSGRGKDRLRHVRSAYDVALRAPAVAQLAARRGGVYL